MNTDASALPAAVAAPPTANPVPLVLSGHTDAALRANAARLADHLTARPDTSLLNVAFSLATTRTALAERAVVRASDTRSAALALAAFAAGELPSGALRATARAARAVFLFPGQGSQYAGMCRALLGDPVFARELAACDLALERHGAASVRALLAADDATQRAALDDVAQVQPVLFAVAVALARRWQALGVHPAAVIGHSQGEVAAAVIAGALSLDDAARVVVVRSRLIATLTSPGAMASLGLAVADVEALLARRKSALSIAVVNTDASTVVAGDPAELDALLADLEPRGVFCRRIAVTYASHAPQMDPILPAIRHGLAGIAPGHASVPFYSTVVGRRIEGTELDAAYWADNLRQPVRLDRALDALGPDARVVFIELSARPMLAAPVSATGRVLVPTLRHDLDARAGLVCAAAELHAHGHPIDWPAVFDGTGARRVELPTYAFQHQRYWHELSRPDAGERGSGDGSAQPRAAQLYELVAHPLPARHAARPSEVAYVERAPDDLNGGLGEADPPPAIVVRWPEGETTAEAIGRATRAALRWLQRWISEERLAGATIVWLTRNACALTGDERTVDASSAAIWGLGRTAQLEQPERHLVLVDVDEPLDEHGVADLLGRLPDGEGQLVVRQGAVYALRLSEVAPSVRSADASRAFAPDGTVLVTGGAGGVGGVTVRHLVQRHGVRHLLLLSRSGLAAPGAAELVAELEATGARVTVRVCDVADRAQLAAAIAGIPSDRPLTAVFHSAVVLDDALLGDLTPERVAAVLAPKLDAAWHLHELTRGMDLAAFVMFSSVTGVFGNAAQGSYAAANAALDALASWRHRQGLPARSIAWGSWAKVGLAARLDEALQRRLRRMGVVPLEPAEGMQLLDEALERPGPVVLALKLDRATLARSADERPDSVPPLLASLVGRPAKRTEAARSPGSSLADRLARLPEPARAAAVMSAIRTELAAVLGLPGPDAVPVDRPLKELGLDSLMAVEARNRLSTLVGQRLPAPLLFDYPSVAELAPVIAIKAGLAPALAPVRTAAAIASTPADEPIAIIAMACRLPGGVQSPEDLWELVAHGRDAIGPFPPRPGWDIAALYDPDPDAVGKCVIKEGGFLPDVGHFDPAFFRISPREAERLDPQQRLLLEVAWEAIERAGIVPSSLDRTATGVYVGVLLNDYGARFIGHPELLDGHIAPGSFGSTASGRISYTLGLEGPALTIDTGCSASLVAIHTAMQALRTGDCDLALAGGVTIFATPTNVIEASRSRGLSPGGRCRAFSDDADGAGFAEGCGMIALERLGDARRHGRRILAVLPGSACNQDGRSQGLTAPSGPAQERVIRKALAAARLTERDIDAVEAHGTGTVLGDPIELGALMATYGAAHTPDAPLYLGALKSNLGHTNGAAGVAGVIKMVMALAAEKLPPTLHARRPTRQVDWVPGVQLLAREVAWPRRPDRRRRAGVSAFGISGTNVHLIVEEAPAPEAVPAQPPAVRLDAIPLVVSGLTEEALCANADRLAAHLEDPSRGSLLDVAFSQATTRTAFAERAVVRASDAASAVRALRQIARGAAPADAVRASARAARLVFVFPGLGSQHAGMCRALLDDPIFADALATCDRALAAFTGVSVVDLLRAPAEAQEAAFARVDQVQPLLFAVAVALARRWQALGVTPSAVVGHSQGEVPAAVIAGALTVEDGARIVCLRSRLIHRLPTDGGMASIGLPLVDVERLLAEQSALSVAVVNGATATVVAGARAELERFVAGREADGVPCRRIKVDRAGHSPEMDAILPEIRAGLAGLSPRPASVPFYSTVRGAILDGPELDAGYWADNLRRPVRLDLAVTAIRPDAATVFVELSAHPVLTAPLSSSGCEAVVPSLRKDGDAASELRIAAATLHAHGIPVDLPAVFDGTGARVVDLPTYAFQRRHHWLAAPGEDRPTAASTVGNGARTPIAGVDPGALVHLAGLSDAERQAALSALVSQETIAVLRLPASDAGALARPFLELGLDSIMAIDLRRQLQRRTGVKVPAEIFFQQATVDRVAGWLSAHVSSTVVPAVPAAPTVTSTVEVAAPRVTPWPTLWIDQRKPNPAAKLRLFCYPHSGGSSSAFRAWHAALPASIEVCPIQPPGRWSRYQEPPPRTVDEAARGLIEGIDGLLDLPFAFVGHSLGASVVFEATRLLEATGGPRPVGLVVAARNAPQRSSFLASHRQAIETAPDEDLVALIGRLYGTDRIRGTDDPTFQAVFMDGLRADLRATARYEYRPGAPLGCALWAFGGLGDALIPATDVEAWQIHTTAAFAWAMLPGDHYFVHDAQSGFLPRIGEALESLIGRA